MRKSTWTPSIVPAGADQNVYLVDENLGRLGQVWRESDCEATDLETVIQDLLTAARTLEQVIEDYQAAL